ncbi:MAG: hypothetical protein IIT70_06795 [Clostridia bacterium]|nr:hypothetical protein [Clostridia bacterium]
MTTETIVIEKTKDNRPWEGCINSVNYRIERGSPVEVPSEVAEVIRRSEALHKCLQAATERFTEPDGARL